MKTKTSLWIVTVCLLLCHFTAYAEITKEYKIADDGFEWYLITENGKQGAQDRNGNMLIPTEYKKLRFEDVVGTFYFYVKDFHNNCAIFNRNGRCIIPASRNYCHVFYDGYGLHDVYVATCWKLENDKKYVYVLCNWKGEEVFKPSKKYSHVTPHYYDGRLFYQVEDFYTGRKGVIDAYEKIIMPLVYDKFLVSGGAFMTEVDNGEWITLGKISQLVPKHHNLFPEGDINSLRPLTTSNTSTPSKLTTTHSHSHRSYPVTLAYCLDGTSQNIKTREVYRQGPQMGFITFYEDKIVVDNKDTYTFWKGDDTKGVKMYQGKAISAHGATAIPVIAIDENLEYVVLFVNVGNATSQARIWLMEVDDFYALWQANQGINNQIFITNSYGEHPSTIPNNDVGTKSYFSDNYGYKECYMCHGSGICPTCNGRGLQHNGFGLDDSKCANCHGNGKCRTCHGTGKVYGKKY